MFKWFKTFSSNSRFKKFYGILEKINALENDIARLRDEEIKNKSLDLKNKANNNFDLNEILPEAFALVREATKRT